MTKHCDEYIDDKTAPQALRDFLAHARAPAVKQTGQTPPLFANLLKPQTGKSWNGKRDKDGNPIMVDVPMSAGTRVKIVMASRIGDVGVTPNLNAENGYILRLDLSEFDNFSSVP